MTTRGVHQYVLGILAKKNLPEEKVTKVQTGGPDGDLGSNEIKISFDRTIAVVDGSGYVLQLSSLRCLLGMPVCCSTRWASTARRSRRWQTSAR